MLPGVLLFLALSLFHRVGTFPTAYPSTHTNPVFLHKTGSLGFILGSSAPLCGSGKAVHAGTKLPFHTGRICMDGRTVSKDGLAPRCFRKSASEVGVEDGAERVTDGDMAIEKALERRQRSRETPLSQKWFKQRQKTITPSQKRVLRELWGLYGLTLEHEQQLDVGEMFPGECRSFAIFCGVCKDFLGDFLQPLRRVQPHPIFLLLLILLCISCVSQSMPYENFVKKNAVSREAYWTKIHLRSPFFVSHSPSPSLCH